MFRGIDTISLDGKGRFSIPTKYREILREHCDCQLVVTKHRDGCLLLYPQPEWDEVELKLARLPSINNRQVRLFKRFMLGNSAQCDMDNHGRVMLPERLRVFARIEKKIVLSSQVDKFEIWAESAWEDTVDEWMGEDEGNLDELKEVAGDLVL